MHLHPLFDDCDHPKAEAEEGEKDDDRSQSSIDAQSKQMSIEQHDTHHQKDSLTHLMLSLLMLLLLL